MINPFEDDLFILDLANNHQGSLDHGLNIIHAFGEIARSNGIKAVFKFQFRDLDTLIHPEFTNSKDNKHINRFTSTRLSIDDYSQLLDAVKEEGLLSMCTPFDEKSVDVNKGDLVLFPSSLFHHTIPFKSNEERVTFAFDIIPQN